MAKKIKIALAELEVMADLNESDTARALWEALPFESEASTWGDEIYFETPVRHRLDPGAKAEVEVGTLAYWPTGSALCLFFGPTPASRGGQPRAASPVNIVGRFRGDPAALRRVPDGTRVRVSRAA